MVKKRENDSFNALVHLPDSSKLRKKSTLLSTHCFNCSLYFWIIQDFLWYLMSHTSGRTYKKLSTIMWATNPEPTNKKSRKYCNLNIDLILLKCLTTVTMPHMIRSTLTKWHVILFTPLCWLLSVRERAKSSYNSSFQLL